MEADRNTLRPRARIWFMSFGLPIKNGHKYRKTLFKNRESSKAEELIISKQSLFERMEDTRISFMTEIKYRHMFNRSRKRCIGCVRMIF